ncbi:MAG: GIY-YIG nuclease family protein [Clostridia bacterium]|nr:GIY-YIG nuclease family protein [Clostridia bacterium]
MKAPNIRTFGDFLPKIYAYTTPEIARHNGWLKIGYTEQDVHTRIRQQTRTADVRYHLEWHDTAIFSDGSGKTFTDKDFHAYLRKKVFGWIYEDKLFFVLHHPVHSGLHKRIVLLMVTWFAQRLVRYGVDTNNFSARFHKLQ